MNNGSLNMEFTHNGVTYLAFIIHTMDLSHEQYEKYNIRESTFLVHLFTNNGFNSFELFHSEDPLVWETNASPMVVDPKIAQIIGERIDSMTM